jgi:multiple sugar transport system permease protein
MFFPIFKVIQSSFYVTDKLGGLRHFAGLENYVTLFKQDTFRMILFQSVYWTVLAVAIKTLFGLILASLLNTKYRGRRFARTLIIIPWASSAPISAILWIWVYHSEFGLLNHSLRALGITQNPPIWLGTAGLVFYSVIWVDIWLGIPFMTLVFLAGMQAVSVDLYEAANVEGANALQKYYHITVPGIRDVLLIATLLSTLWTFNDFNTIYVMTRGGPVNSTHIIITYLYMTTFERLRWGQGAVMAVITLIILSFCAWIYSRLYFRKGD